MAGVNTRRIAFAGVVAALYAALTIGLSFIGYGPLQFRVAEALCVLPFFFPFSVWGLFVGCIIANLVSPFPLDVVVGPLATLLAAFCTMFIGKYCHGKFFGSKRGRGSPGREGRERGSPGLEKTALKALACLPPVLINAVFIGALIAYYMAGSGEADAFASAFLLNAAQIAMGQAVVLYMLGLPLMLYLPGTRIFGKLYEQQIMSSKS